MIFCAVGDANLHVGIILNQKHTGLPLSLYIHTFHVKVYVV